MKLCTTERHGDVVININHVIRVDQVGITPTGLVRVYLSDKTYIIKGELSDFLPKVYVGEYPHMNKVRGGAL